MFFNHQSSEILDGIPAPYTLAQQNEKADLMRGGYSRAAQNELLNVIGRKCCREI